MKRKNEHFFTTLRGFISQQEAIFFHYGNHNTPLLGQVCARYTLFALPYPFSLASILILFSYLRLWLPPCLCGFYNKTFAQIIINATYTTSNAWTLYVPLFAQFPLPTLADVE